MEGLQQSNSAYMYKLAIKSIPKELILHNEYFTFGTDEVQFAGNTLIK